MNIVPSVPSKLYTISATIIGFLLIDDLTPAEQNSLGNWFMLLAQVLCTNAAQQQLLNNRNKSMDDTIITDEKNIETLKKAIYTIQKEINNLQK